MKQAIALAYAHARESRVGDAWRMTGDVVDFVTPIALTIFVTWSLVGLVIGHLR